jgi:ribosome assembly protein YihI (activator of Der GTPase)
MINSLGNIGGDHLKSLAERLQESDKAAKPGDAGNILPLENPKDLVSSDISLSADSIKLLDLEKQLSALSIGPELSAEQQQKVDALNKEIDAIMNRGMRQWSNADLKSMEDSYAAMDALFADGKLTASEEKTMNALEQRLDSLFSKYEPKLSPEQEQQLNKLFEQLDAIYEQGMAPVNDIDSMADAMHIMAKDSSAMLSEVGVNLFKNLDEKLTSMSPEIEAAIAAASDQTAASSAFERLDSEIQTLLGRFEQHK